MMSRIPHSFSLRARIQYPSVYVASWPQIKAGERSRSPTRQATNLQLRQSISGEPKEHGSYARPLNRAHNKVTIWQFLEGPYMFC